MQFQEGIKCYNRMCDFYQENGTSGCPMRDKGCSGCMDRLLDDPYRAEYVVSAWTKDHPVQTNADVFKKTFGTNEIEVGSTHEKIDVNTTKWGVQEYMRRV